MNLSQNFELDLRKMYGLEKQRRQGLINFLDVIREKFQTEMNEFCDMEKKDLLLICEKTKENIINTNKKGYLGY